MFIAMLLVCNIYATETCMVAQDSWGPYATKAECDKRIAVMIGDVKQIAPNTFIKATRCELVVKKGTPT